jgi:hypothetical protein
MSLERDSHTTACSCQDAEPGSQSQSPDFTGSQICHQPVHQHKPRWQSSGGFCFPPCHLVLGTVGSPTSYCFKSGGWGLQTSTADTCPLSLGVCVWGGELTFSAKTGLPESSVRCRNSKCRDPNSARMLLLPAVAQPQLPLKRHQLCHPAGSLAESGSSCGTGWCLLCARHLG